MSEFLDLGLSASMVETITQMGFESPTPIQTQAIPHLLTEETDMVGLAQTGTGKTAAFGLPLIERVDADLSNVQALVLAPTRELCLQITNEFQEFSKHDKGIRVVAIYGGADISKQIKQVRRGAHIVVATPGRLRDMIRRKAVDLSMIRFLVLDEADEMLNMGFKEEIDDILQNTPEEKLTWLFSATMPPELRRISMQYMKDPLEMAVARNEVTNADIEHQYVRVYPSDRAEVLKRFLDAEPDMFALVFCRTRNDTKDLAMHLGESGYQADALHGDLSQWQRDQVMGRFRARQINILVATDVAARGIDVKEITHVFHFNIPEDKSFYTHRSGRTARAGEEGISLVLAHPKDTRQLVQLERRLKIRFKEVAIPTAEDICRKQLFNYFSELQKVSPNEALENFLPAILLDLDDLSKEDIVERMAALSFNHFFEKYQNAPDLNLKKNKKKQQRDLNQKKHKLFINVGFMDLAGKGEFLALICNQAGIRGESIGRIELKRSFAYFDVDEEVVDQVKKAFRDFYLEGRSIRVNDGQQYGKSKKKKKHKKKK
jgi:ATP-dependent RNA helicase DeaD